MHCNWARFFADDALAPDLVENLMEMYVAHGNVERLSAPDQKGGIDCQVGDVKVRFSRDLSDYVRAGDKVVVAGDIKDKVLQAFAMKNFALNKKREYDLTKDILVLGVAAFVVIYSGVMAMQAKDFTMYPYLAVSLAAVFAVLHFFRRVRFIARCVNRIVNSELIDE
jgi:hypothetical protein